MGTNAHMPFKPWLAGNNANCYDQAIEEYQVCVTNFRQ
jgi:hypothetical protein